MFVLHVFTVQCVCTPSAVCKCTLHILTYCRLLLFYLRLAGSTYSSLISSIVPVGEKEKEKEKERERENHCEGVGVK